VTLPPSWSGVVSRASANRVNAFTLHREALMQRYFLFKTGQSILLLLDVLILVFFLVSITGDEARLMDALGRLTGGWKRKTSSRRRMPGLNVVLSLMKGRLMPALGSMGFLPRYARPG
jgi:hypothetical protein